MRIQFKNIKNVSIDEIFDYLKDLIVKNNLKIDNMNLYVNFLKEGTPVTYSNEKGEEYNLLINGIIGQISPYIKRDTSIDFLNKKKYKIQNIYIYVKKIMSLEFLIQYMYFFLINLIN